MRNSPLRNPGNNGAHNERRGQVDSMCEEDETGRKEQGWESRARAGISTNIQNEGMAMGGWKAGRSCVAT